MNLGFGVNGLPAFYGCSKCFDATGIERVRDFLGEILAERELLHSALIVSNEVHPATGRPLPNFGRYETTRLLGRGGFAAVYESYDPALDATVAIKVLAEHFSADPELRQRFITEARLLRRIGSDRLVAVHDIGESDGQPFFVMGLVRGGTLADRIAELNGRPVDANALSLVVTELAAGLEAIHAAGVVHRDIKPSNLLIELGGTDRGNALLASGERLILGDFGLARELDASKLTRAVGTHGYMAPEQRSPSATIDQRADLYAATAIVAELLGGDAARAQLSGPAQNAVASGLADDPSHRPADARQWAKSLLDGFASNPHPLGQSAPDPGAGSGAQTDQRTKRRLLGAGLAAAVVGLVAWLGSGSDVAGPTIIGPEQIEVGETTVYRAEIQADATYYWTDWAAIRHDGPALEVSASTPGVLPIALTQVLDGSETRRELVITVEDR